MWKNESVKLLINLINFNYKRDLNVMIFFLNKNQYKGR